MTDVNFAVEKLCGRKIENPKIKNEKIFNTPILFLVFNRLDTTKKVFEEIRKAKPKQLFIASDGWRNEKEKIKVKEIRSYLLNNVDWSCHVKTLFRDKNLGCKNAVSSAIDWFFENVEQGIILEDDCLPNQTFFKFCEELLNKYKDNKKIWSIAGTSPLEKVNINEDYYFSKYFFCWGWATWRNRWKKVDINMNNYSIHKTNLNFLERIIYGRRFKENIKKGTSGTWDLSFLYSQLKNKGLCIVPRVNLVENIGMNDGTNKFSKIDKKYLCKKRVGK